MDNPLNWISGFQEILEPDVDPCDSLEVPTSREVLPDGTEVILIGDPQWAAGFNHRQGENSLGYLGTCGLVSCEQILRRTGLEVTEDDIVRYAGDRGLCVTDACPELNGGTTLLDQARILTEFGVPARPELLVSTEELAHRLEEGRSVILAVNAGEFWNDPAAYGTGAPNHAILATGVARDAQTGEIVGVFINDSGTGNSAQFVPVQDLEIAWLEPGGLAVTTDGCPC